MASPVFYRLQQALCIVLFFLIILGAGVRIAGAGLACPDWPLCFGEAIPTFDFKIFMEWIHRVIAAVSGLIALVVAIRIWTHSVLRPQLGWLAVASLLLFGFQAFLGRQTVLQFLKAETVAAHLMGGYSLFALSLYILYRWRIQKVTTTNPLKWGFIILAILTFVQATLGGTVSSHYAGMACGEFPKCQGEWWPEFVGPVAYHFVHRLGALFLLVASLLLSAFVFTKTTDKYFRALSLLGFLLVALQWVWGVSMLFSAIHPALSLAHSATAISIFTVYVMGVLRGNHR